MLDSTDIERRRGECACRAAPPPRMELVVIAPQLLSVAAAALNACASLARIAAWSRHAADAGASEEALLAALDLPRAAAGALLARAAGIDAGSGGWLVADPVALVAGIDDVTVIARADMLDPAFVARALALLNAHFAADSLQFAAPRAARWLAHVADAPELTLKSTDAALGRSMYAQRPQGPDARRFERYANEIQMLLHEAPENDARERAGLAPFNGLWLWGAGAAITPAARVDAYATADAEGDLARGIALASGGRAQPLGDRLAFDADAATIVVVALPPIVPASLAACDAGWLAPSTDALARGAISRLTLVADGAGTHRWTANAPTWRARLMARLRASQFSVPA